MPPKLGFPGPRTQRKMLPYSSPYLEIWSPGLRHLAVKIDPVMGHSRNPLAEAYGFSQSPEPRVPTVSSTGCRANHASILMPLRNRKNIFQLPSLLCSYKGQHAQEPSSSLLPSHSVPAPCLTVSTPMTSPALMPVTPTTLRSTLSNCNSHFKKRYYCS